MNDQSDFAAMLGMACDKVRTPAEERLMARMVRRRALLGDGAEFTIAEIETIRALATRQLLTPKPTTEVAVA